MKAQLYSVVLTCFWTFVFAALPADAQQARAKATDLDQIVQPALPFDQLPTPYRLVDQERNKSNTNVESSNSTADAKSRDSGDMVHFFALPAHFPRAVFGPGPCNEVLNVERQGAVIFEDMTVHMDKSGKYSVSFVVQTPAVPTELQLALTFFECEKCEGCKKNVKCKHCKLCGQCSNVSCDQCPPLFTITLPPIWIDPINASPSRDGIYTITHSGHSNSLAHAILKSKVFQIKREGIARYGFPSSKYIDEFQMGKVDVREYAKNPVSDHQH